MARRALRTIGCALAASGIIAAAGEARAAGQSSRLESIRGPGAESCPDAKRLSAIITARLGYDPFDAHTKRLVTVHIRRGGDRLEAHVETFDADGRRTG